MALWLILIIIGVILLILGFVGVAHILIWIGIILAVIALIGWIVSRGRISRV
jgi:hypothetical protein